MIPLLDEVGIVVVVVVAVVDDVGVVDLSCNGPSNSVHI
jgi:hypothetical protein